MCCHLLADRLELFSHVRGLSERRVIKSPLGAISLVLISWEWETTLPGHLKANRKPELFWNRPSGFGARRTCVLGCDASELRGWVAMEPH